MNKDAKNISSSSRGTIATLKCEIRSAVRPFYGDGYAFKKALSELRKEGIVIKLDRKLCRYYNPQTIDNIWGYANAQS